MRTSLFPSRHHAEVSPSAHAEPPGTSRRSVLPALLVAALLLLGLALASPAGATVYWGNTAGTTIGRANTNGTGVSQSFIGGASQPGGIAVDGAHIYWTNDLDHTIGRANLDGSGVNQRFITGVSTDALAVDGAHIYWPNVIDSTPGGDAIGRANLDGTQVNQRFITGATNPSGIAVDGAHLYWGNENTNTIGRANLDGTGANQSFIAGPHNPTGVAVDGSHIYWTGLSSILIGRANLDGTGVNLSFIRNNSDTFGVAVDSAHLYWTNGHVAGDSAIGRANLDGTEVIPRFITGASSPEAVAVDGRTVGAVQDTTPPETTITSGPSGTVTSTSATFAFAANEASASFECRLDGGAWAPCSTPKSYTALLAGSHAFDVRATDPTGNVDATPARQTWTITPSGGPANDLFASARAISGAAGTTTGSTVGATKEVGEPNHVGNPGGSSVWYAWTAPATGTVSFDTVGSAFDTLLAAYTGTSVGALTQVAANDDSGGNTTSRVSFAVTAGTTYTIAVDGYFGAAGSVVVNWSLNGASSGGGGSSGVANDMFAAARALAGRSGTINATTVGATKESGEPNHAGNTGGRSIWATWTAPATATVTFDTIGSAFDTLLAAYTGSAVNALTQTAANDDASGLQSRISFPAVAGTTYRIAVDGYAGASGAVTLTWSQP